MRNGKTQTGLGQYLRGAHELCLFGETTDGAAIEGCDAIDTEPRRPRRPARRGD